MGSAILQFIQRRSPSTSPVSVLAASLVTPVAPDQRRVLPADVAADEAASSFGGLPIKARNLSMLGFRSFASAANLVSGSKLRC